MWKGNPDRLHVCLVVTGDEALLLVQVGLVPELVPVFLRLHEGEETVLRLCEKFFQADEDVHRAPLRA